MNKKLYKLLSVIIISILVISPLSEVKAEDRTVSNKGDISISDKHDSIRIDDEKDKELIDEFFIPLAKSTYIKSCSLGLSKSGSNANCVASITGYSTVKKVKIYMYLQKQDSKGNSQPYSSWSASKDSYYLTLGTTSLNVTSGSIG